MFIAIKKTNYHKIGKGKRVYLKGYDAKAKFRIGYGYVDRCKSDSRFITINQYNKELKCKLMLTFRKENVQLFIERLDI